jgi:formate dehydrogenase beta subunit
MDKNRRSFLKGCAAAAAMTAIPATALARARQTAPAGAVGMLYDATKCIGCKSCSVACKEVNNLPADATEYGGGLYDAPTSLNERTKSVIQLYHDEGQSAFVKKQCMHCVDPGCVTACMLGAMQKDKVTGIVTWEGNTCIGCRYCQQACPFNVAKFEWDQKFPKIVKCELCKDRLAKGQQPACVEVCPRGAITYGQRADLLDEAHKRITAKPNLYVNKVYGETDLGGTQVLYLSHVEFEKLGFQFSDKDSAPHTQQTVQHGLYQGFVGPIALYAILGAVVFRNRGNIEGKEE